VEIAQRHGRRHHGRPIETDAWFVTCPAIAHPPIAVAVMLVEAGAGGANAAPIAR